jgi:hypothetical protein
MPKLFVANATPQVHEFTYIVPDDDNGRVTRWQPRVQPIRPGGQVQIAGDLNVKQIESIIEHHSRYGMVAVSEIDRTKRFVGLCYSLDKPVSAARIHQLMNGNMDVLELKGRKMREEAAIAVSNEIEDTMREQRMPGELKAFEINVTEVRTPQSDSEETLPQRVRVTREVNERGEPTPNAGRNLRGKGRGRG